MSFDRYLKKMSMNASRVASEYRIDQKNAERRHAFLEEFAAIAETELKTLSVSERKTDTQVDLCMSDHLLGLPVGSKTVYPAFQFDEEGRPNHLVKRVLNALPEDMTPWQIAFWLVSPASTLDGGRPASGCQRDG